MLNFYSICVSCMNLNTKSKGFLGLFVFFQFLKIRTRLWLWWSTPAEGICMTTFVTRETSLSGRRDTSSDKLCQLCTTATRWVCVHQILSYRQSQSVYRICHFGEVSLFMHGCYLRPNGAALQSDSLLRSLFFFRALAPPELHNGHYSLSACCSEQGRCEKDAGWT